MGNIGDIFTTSVPTVGASGPQYATDINAILTEAIARLSAKIPLTSLSFNSDLNLSGSKLTNAGGLIFSNLSSTPIISDGTNRFAAFNGDIYWVNTSGVVQITSNGLLNSAAVGGITGDYGGANPAQFRMDSVSNTYRAYANFASLSWAYLRSFGIDIAAGAASTVFARLQFGGASNITLTLPPSLPANNQLLSVDNTGAITAGSAAQLGNNNSITLTGSGTYKHGTKTISKAFKASEAVVASGTVQANTVAGLSGATMSASSTVYFPMPEMPTHWRILNVTIVYDNATSRTNAGTVGVQYTGNGDPAVGTYTATGAVFSTSGTAKHVATGVNLLFSLNQTYWIKFITGGGGASTPVNMIIDYDVP